MSTKFALGPDSSDKNIHVSLVNLIGVAFTGAMCPVAASMIIGGVELPDEISLSRSISIAKYVEPEIETFCNSTPGHATYLFGSNL